MKLIKGCSHVYVFNMSASKSYYLLQICVGKSNSFKQQYLDKAREHNLMVDAHIADPLSTYDSGFDLICPKITYITNAEGCSGVQQVRWHRKKQELLRVAVESNTQEASIAANHAQEVCNVIRHGILQLHRERNSARMWEMDGLGRNLGVKLDHKIKCCMMYCRETLDNSNNACVSTQRIVGYYLYPRSSMGTKTTLRLSNSCGIIDSGYRGNIIAALDNIGNDYIVDAGDRLVQICPPDLAHPMKVEIVDSLDMNTARNEGGFGSTGK